MITNKLLALVLSLCTAGGVTAGTVANTNCTVPQGPTNAAVQKQVSSDLNNGQTVKFLIDKNGNNTCSIAGDKNTCNLNDQCNNDNSCNTGTQCNDENSCGATDCSVPQGSNCTISDVTKPNTNSGEESSNPAAPVVEEPKAEAPVSEVPKVETPVKDEPKTEAPKVEAPATTPSTTVPSGVPANPNNKSFKYLDTVEKEILTYVNQERANAGLKPLAWEENMRPIARYKSNNMLQYNYFEHNTPSLNNAGPMDLAAKYFKYNTNGYGENIFYSMGYPEATTTAKYLVDQWMNSPGHRANILNPNWTKMSAGVVFSSQGNYVYATQHFSTK